MAFAKKNSKPNALFSYTPTKNIKNKDSVNQILYNKNDIPDSGRSMYKPSPKESNEDKPVRGFILPGKNIATTSKRPLRRSQSAHSLLTNSPSIKKMRSGAEIDSPNKFKTLTKSESISDELNKKIQPIHSKTPLQSPSKTMSEPRLHKCQINLKSSSSVHKILVSSSMKLRNSENKGVSCVKTTTSNIDTTPILSNIRQIRSRFENKVVIGKPPPSPSPAKRCVRFEDYSKLAKSAKENQKIVVNYEQGNNRLKGILNPQGKVNEMSPFIPRAGTSTPINKINKLKRSISSQDLSEYGSSKRHTPRPLTRSHSELQRSQQKRLQDPTPECYSPVLVEHQYSSKKLNVDGECTNLTVGVRVRPPLFGENEVVHVEGSMIRVEVDQTAHCFTYDHCFTSTGPEGANQERVFKAMVQPLVETAFKGYNACLFAYGQTGSGKSYSMMGWNDELNLEIAETSGIIPRFCYELFKQIKPEDCTKIEISYFEIYNEKIHDLLAQTSSGRGEPLRVREHPELGPYVVNLTTHIVHSFESVMDWIVIGNNHRASAATDMNENSSRSHSIFSITMKQQPIEGRLDVPSLCSKINLVDLAGSERLANSSATGDRLKESVSINKSLLTLGKVISSLSENKKKGFIPYRESILTWLLRESLGGNSKTMMLATISPDDSYIDETLSTLRYACQARNIVNTVRINENPQEKRIRELIEEKNNLTHLCKILEENGKEELTTKVSELQTQLSHTTNHLNQVKQLLDLKKKENLELREANTSLLKKIEAQNTDFEEKVRKLRREEEEKLGRFSDLRAKVEQLELSLYVHREKEEINKPLLEQLRKLNILCPKGENKENFGIKNIKPTMDSPKENDLLNPSPEVIHEALKEAAEICNRLRLPYVFHPEPEVTTHTWFNINIRVTDKTELSSVRWSQSAFLSWLQTMKDNITSSSRGRILFSDVEWIQKVELKPVPFTPLKNSGLNLKEQPLRDEVNCLKEQIASLKVLCQERSTLEVTTAINTLVDAVNILTQSLGVQTPTKNVLTPMSLSNIVQTPKPSYFLRRKKLLNT